MAVMEQTRLTYRNIKPDIGAEVLATPDEPGILRFFDNNRIAVELKAT